MTAPEPGRAAPNALVGWLATGGALVAGAMMLATLGPLFGKLPPSLTAVQAPAPLASPGTEENRRITAAEFAEVVEGMPYEEAVRRIGDPGEAQGSATLNGVSATAYVWTNEDGSRAAIIFRQGKMAMKTQSGL
ncbi:MAG TPA: hypothetical protein VEZ48_10450 [Sphingomonadaceae bacterium]|nr:hypothetical protein [Sphingomonadaceae bacterium]